MLPFDLHWPSFAFGFGLVVFLALIVFLINWIGNQSSPFKPQTVIQTTKKTPWQVLMGCASSVLMLGGLGVMIAVGVVMIGAGATLPEVGWMIGVAAVSFVTGLFVRGLVV